jgi:hypothetical protein
MSKSGHVTAGILGIGAVSMIVFGVIDANAATVEYEEVDEPIKYTTETYYDNTLREGNTRVDQEGKDGKKTVKYAVTYKYGKEVSRKTESVDIIEKAQNKKISKGTKKYYKCSNGVEYDNLAAKNECENRVSWEKTKNSMLQECYADSSRFNCWFDEYPGTTLHWSYYTYTNTKTGGRTGAICRDGWRSSATGRGACSHHGGVSYWLY